MQWFVQIWNSTVVSQEDSAVLGADGYRYEVAVALMSTEKRSFEVAEIALKVLDWNDNEPFIAYYLLLYIDRVVESDLDRA